MKQITRTYLADPPSGIYCDPVACDDQQPAETAVRYPSAAAAEAAGFRACRQCRPYRSPVSVPWNGSELTCRAVRLILDGALDGRLEVQLASRLGVSTRHLRRLFTTHLGVTPARLARSARAHFAARLLDDTDLPITEIAYAAGFGSVRQFNRVCQEVFRAAPGELRALGGSGGPLDTEGGLALRLHYRGPLDWAAMLESIAAYAIPGVEQVRGRTYHRTIQIDRQPGTISIAPGSDEHLVLRVRLPTWRPLLHVAERARRLANLDLDVTAAVDKLAKDPQLGPHITANPGLRPPGAWDGFEIGVRAILGGQLPRAVVLDHLGQLVERLGTPVAEAEDRGLSHAFPTARRIATADLADLGFPVEQARAIQAFARAVVSDRIRLDGSVGLDGLVASTVAVDGVGPRIPHDIALRLGEPDAWPLGGPDDGVAAALAGRWRPWRAVAATHLRRAGAGPAAGASARAPVEVRAG